MFNAVNRNGYHDNRSAVLHASCAYIVNHYPHVCKHTRNIGKKTDSVEAIKLKGALEVLTNRAVPISGNPAFRFVRLAYILGNIGAVSRMNGNAVSSCYKSDDFITRKRIAAA